MSPDAPHLLLWNMRRRLLPVALFALSCTDTVDPAVCPQTYEFGNYGCAQVVARVTTQSDASVIGHFAVSVKALDPNSGFEVAGVQGATPGTYTISLTRWVPRMEGTGDTVSVWVKAGLFDASYTLVAVDSIPRVIRFAPVGQIRTVDSVSLVLKPFK